MWPFLPIGNAQYEKICVAAKAAGRPHPIWYSCKDGEGDSSTAVAEWLEKRDLMTDDWISRGWEDKTIIVMV